MPNWSRINKERRFDKAKQYCARAAGHPSDVGKSAFGSLVELDLADNPGKYIGLRTGVDKQGRVLAVISNPTPQNITGLVIALQFPDAKGRLQEVQRKMRGQLKAEQKQQVDLGIKVDPEQAGQVRSKVVAAHIAK